MERAAAEAVADVRRSQARLVRAVAAIPRPERAPVPQADQTPCDPNDPFGLDADD